MAPESPEMATTVGIVSYNLWLMPYAGPYNLGRVDRCGAKLRAAARQLEADGCGLIVVCPAPAFFFFL